MNPSAESPFQGYAESMEKKKRKAGDKGERDLIHVNVAFVGGGKGCRDVLRLLTMYPLRSLKLKVIGVADPKHDAPGRVFAEELRIKTTSDYKEFYKYPELDLIIELTGDDQVLDEILSTKPKRVKVLDHLGARLLWEIIEIQEEKLILEERLSASEKMVAVGEMAYRLTHDLRNPLMCIGGLTRRLLLNPDTPHYLRRQMEQIISYVEKMEKAVANICDVARPIYPHYQPTDITCTLKSWCKGVRYEARRYNVEVVCRIEEDLPKLIMDKELISQVLWHVAEHAMETMSTSTRRLLIQARLCLDEVLIVLEQDGEEEVECPGRLELGVSESVSPTKRSSLWLAMCRKIMSDHGGDIRVERRAGRLIVVIELPVRFEMPAGPPI